MAVTAHLSIPGKTFGLASEHTEAADVFVLITLAFLFFVLGIGAASAWILWRRAHYPKPHRKLLMELEAEQTVPQPAAAEPPPEGDRSAWERDPDWWKKD
jgi:hypothetical protein